METRNISPKPATDSCEELLELLPAYSLGIATAEEERRVRKLLTLCPEGAEVLQDYQAISDNLVALVPNTEAPPSSAALLKRVRESAPQKIAAPVLIRPIEDMQPQATSNHASQPRLQARRPWGWLALAACFLVAFIGTNVYWASQLDTLRREQQAFLQTLAANQTQQPLAINAANHHRDLLPNDASTQNTDASFVWNSSDQIGALVVDGLPSLKPGETYQLWLVNDEQSLSLGTFEVDETGTGVLIFHSSQPVETFSHIGVNIEPEGGTPKPTTPHLIIGNI